MRNCFLLGSMLLVFIAIVGCNRIKKPNYQIKFEGTSWELTSYSVDGKKSNQINSMEIISANEENNKNYDIDYIDFRVQDSVAYVNDQSKMFPYADGGIFRYAMDLFTPSSKADIENQLLGAFIITKFTENQQSFHRQFRVLDVSKSKLILEYDGNNDPFKSESETLPGAIERFEFTALD